MKEIEVREVRTEEEDECVGVEGTVRGPRRRYVEREVPEVPGDRVGVFGGGWGSTSSRSYRRRYPRGRILFVTSVPLDPTCKYLVIFFKILLV